MFTPQELYALLDNAGVEYEVVEMFEGIRVFRIQVWDEKEEVEEHED